MATVAKGYKHKHSLRDTRHLMRYLNVQAKGGNHEAIAIVAKEEHVSAETVRHSVSLIESYQNKNSKMEFDLALRDLVISAVPQAKETLAGLLTATELVETKNAKDGSVKVISVADKTTRLEALRVVNSFISSLQPKAPIIENKVQATAQALSATVSQVETNEERFRRLRARVSAHNELPQEVAAVPEYIDAGEDSGDGEEDEDEDDSSEEAESAV